jgi:transposase
MPRPSADIENRIRVRWARMKPLLDERQRRLLAASEALALGHGGIAAVQRATGLAWSTVRAGIDELQQIGAAPAAHGAVRRPGAGRPSLEDTQPGVGEALAALAEPARRGDPESPLCWMSKSTRKLAEELKKRGFTVSHDTVLRMLKDQGYSMQKNRKTLEGASHPDRDRQFLYIAKQATIFQQSGQPVISVDTKKKELVGNYGNGGQEWQPKGEPVEVLTYDFPNGKPKAVPYGVYDTVRNEGMVSVGMSSDTAEFATASIARWWREMGQHAYPGANGYRLRLWRLKLQELADELGLAITVCHLPPGTSKWNKIEHRLFSFISMNWRGRPLVSYEAIVELIAATTTEAGLTVRCELDDGVYKKGIKVTDEELDRVHIERSDFHGEWNYTVVPR